MAPLTLELLKIWIIFASIGPQKSPHMGLCQLLLRQSLKP